LSFYLPSVSRSGDRAECACETFAGLYVTCTTSSEAVTCDENLAVRKKAVPMVSTGTAPGRTCVALVIDNGRTGGSTPARRVADVDVAVNYPPLPAQACRNSPKQPRIDAAAAKQLGISLSSTRKQIRTLSL
jgi:hypothetical protein